jgi:hypothetical protein
MATDRQDIDALLIGALYGELDGDERARLDAHLASHPQDRSALEGMRSTRAMLRDAELVSLLGAAEPPPAISARLIQEAARRAPVKAAGGGWVAFLSTLFRPLVASPALSAAAAFVLIAGAAGVLYTRDGGMKTQEPTVAGSRNAETTAAAPGPGSALWTAPAAAPEPAAAGTAAATGSIDDYRVSLEEQGKLEGAVADGEGDDLGRDRSIEQDKAKASRATAAERNAQLKDEVFALDGLAKQDAANGFQTKGGKQPTAKKTGGTETMKLGATGDAAAATRPGYIALDPAPNDAPTVLTPDGNRADLDAAKRTEADRKESERAIKNSARGAGGGIADKAPARGAGGGGSAAPSTPEATAPAAPPPGAPQKPAQIARDQGSKSQAYNPTAAAALDSWARDQHARMVKLVQGGKCTDAGAIGAEIARKAPDYYQANVANDRQVRSCRSYVDRARRAKSDDAKTKAASPRAPAPDMQQDLESPAPSGK